MISLTVRRSLLEQQDQQQDQQQDRNAGREGP